jgi:putative transposase
VHLLVSTPKENTVSAFMQYLNGNYSKAYNKMHGKTGRFWGGRFYSTIIESETQFFNTLTYIELNMTRAKVVEDPKDWKWSSYNAHAFGTEDRVLDFHPLYEELGKNFIERRQNYRNMVYGQMEEKGLLPNPALTRGIVLGSESFVTSILQMFQGKYSFYSHRKLIACKQDGFCINRPHRNPILLS